MKQSVGAIMIGIHVRVQAQRICHNDLMEGSIGKGAFLNLCESQPTFYEMCAVGMKHGGADKCVPVHEWDRIERRVGPEGQLRHSHSGHWYERLYPIYLNGMRWHSVRLLEIGSFKGDSLRLWLRYFRRASHFALVDLEPQTDLINAVAAETRTQSQIPAHDYSIYTADQSKKEQLEQVVASDGGNYDLIIDDGSHLCRHIKISFEVLFPHLKPGGVYIIEDLNRQYENCQKWLHTFVDVANRALLPNPDTITNYPSTRADQNVVGIHCVLEACALTKGFSRPVRRRLLHANHTRL